MRKSNITIYDLQMRKVAMLENAANIGYETPFNACWTASFEMPLNDEKNAYCRPFHYVELWDGDERLELFRILPQTAQRTEQTQVIKYTCEHVLATLIDDVMFRYHTVGNLGVYTADVLQYILDRQSTPHWELGTVDFARQFEYNWENAALLAALFSVPKSFDEEYQWTYDTTSYPWKLNLVRPSDQVQAFIRYGKNMRGITKTEDPTSLINRIYALGYGEGVNQLNLAEANGGVPYIEDADSIAKYGVKASVWADRRYTSSQTLLGRAQAMLTESKDPRLTYTVQAAELYALTNDPIDKFRTGSLVRVQDPDIGDTVIRVVNVKKGNVRGAPGNVTLEIANRRKDMAGTVADLQNRMKIEEIYSQGATNVNVYNLAENCDPAHPAKLRIWIPEEAVRINKVLLTYENEPFRANSKAVGSAPATTSGASSTTTTGPSSTQTTAAAPQDTSGASSISTTGQTTNEQSTTPGSIIASVGSWMSGLISSVGNHDHGIPQGTQLLVAGGGSVAWTPSGGHAHDMLYHIHNFWSTPHYHEMPHFHTIPSHSHEMPHTHSMPHTHEIPSHTHEIEFGIYEGPVASAITLRVDGEMIPEVGTSETNIDLTNYLSVDEEGKIQRGQFHEIEISPNNLSRVVASVVIQFFVQSRGGGDY